MPISGAVAPDPAANSAYTQGGNHPGQGTGARSNEIHPNI